MKRLTPVFIFILITLISFNCQKEISFNGPGSSGNGAGDFTGILQGNIVDENGEPAAGVTIKLGTKTVSTNAKGYFRITNANLNRKATHLTAQKPGYFKSHRSFQATEGTNQVLIQLIRKNLVGTINAANGGEVILSNGSKLSLPANGITDGTSAYTGTVNIYAAYIDPTAPEISATVPGSLMADDKNSKRVTLASFGMMAVELESGSGNKLQVASGKNASLTMPIPSSIQSSAPSTISLWYLDETSGIWKEEGTATKNGTNYVGDVKHFSFWNCDIGIPAVDLSLILKDNHAAPIVHALVRISRVNASNASPAYGYTDSLGKVSGLVPSNENLLLEVLDLCGNSVYSHNIGPFTQNTNLGTITAQIPTASQLNIQGRIVNCNNVAINNGYAVINYDNMVRYVSVDASGHFNLSFITCPSNLTVFDVFPVDLSNQQQGAVLSVPVTLPATNTGDLMACGISSLQYITYVLDDTSYTITSAVASDSLFGFTQPNGMTSIVGANYSNGKYLHLNFTSPAAAGVYPVNNLTANYYQAVTVVQPFEVTITNFPQTTAQFYEGSFSGQFREINPPAALHTISGTFRLRKM